MAAKFQTIITRAFSRQKIVPYLDHIEFRYYISSWHRVAIGFINGFNQIRWPVTGLTNCDMVYKSLY